MLEFDPLEGPGFQGFYELLRGPEGTDFVVKLSGWERWDVSNLVRGWLEHTQYCHGVSVRVSSTV